jgi:opacity protein-like surface antigen
MHALRTTLALLLGLALAQPALAEGAAPDAKASDDEAGPYLKVVAEVNTVFQSDIDLRLPGGRIDGVGKYDWGLGSTLSVGYRFDRCWGIEVEWGYRRTELKSFKGFEGTRVEDGDFAAGFFLLNVQYRLDVDLPVRPYISVGLGWVEEIDLDLELPGFGESGFDDHALGYQATLGLEWQTGLGGLFVFAEARLFGAAGHELRGEDIAGFADAPYRGVAARFGLGYGF